MEQQPQTSPPARARRPSGRDAKIAARTARSQAFVPYITRKIPYYEVLGEEGLALLEHNADTILEEIGIDFRDDPESLQIWKEAGADVQGRARALPARHVPQLVQRSRAPGIHPARAQPGAQRRHRRQPHGVRARLRLAVRAQPRRGPPLRAASRISAISSSSPTWRPRCTTRAAPSASRSICRSTSGISTWCTAHMKYSDKPYMGSVTHPERAHDTVEMTRILFGDEFHGSGHRQAAHLHHRA